MLISMTGFGKAEGSIHEMNVTVEMKSVNSRYLEIFVATPKFLNFLEEPLQKYIRSRIRRGNIHCYVNVSSTNNTLANYVINKPLLKNFMATVREIAKETQIEPRVSMQDLLSQPELLALEESTLDYDILEIKMIEILDKAIAELLEMEKNEGEFIRQIFDDRLHIIEEQLQHIEVLQKENIPQHIETLRTRIRKLLNDEPNDLALNQELVQLADKLDINEEIDRFYSHLQQFTNYLDSNDAVGKRLNFLLQEINREITTMGNKASNSKISQHVVEIKNEIEAIREQVQNIQ